MIVTVAFEWMMDFKLENRFQCWWNRIDEKCACVDCEHILVNSRKDYLLCTVNYVEKIMENS